MILSLLRRKLAKAQIKVSTAKMMEALTAIHEVDVLHPTPAGAPQNRMILSATQQAAASHNRRAQPEPAPSREAGRLPVSRQALGTHAPDARNCPGSRRFFRCCGPHAANSG
jgi:hypothetical protein